jgi:hypothetical protein
VGAPAGLAPQSLRQCTFGGACAAAAAAAVGHNSAGSDAASSAAPAAAALLRRLGSSLTDGVDSGAITGQLELELLVSRLQSNGLAGEV